MISRYDDLNFLSDRYWLPPGAIGSVRSALTEAFCTSDLGFTKSNGLFDYYIDIAVFNSITYLKSGYRPMNAA